MTLTPADHTLLTDLATGAVRSLSQMPQARIDDLQRRGLIGAQGRATAKGVAALLSDEDTMILATCGAVAKSLLDTDRAGRLERLGLLTRHERKHGVLWSRTTRGDAVLRARQGQAT